MLLIAALTHDKVKHMIHKHIIYQQSGSSYNVYTL